MVSSRNGEEDDSGEIVRYGPSTRLLRAINGAIPPAGTARRFVRGKRGAGEENREVPVLILTRSEETVAVAGHACRTMPKD